MKRHLRPSEPHWRINPDTGCWLWLGALDKDGYGVSWRNGKFCRAHVHTWLDAGREIPEGKVLDHKVCRMRRCVNPDHLEPASAMQNVRRSGRTKLRPEQVRRIRKMLKKGVRASYLATLFGVHKSNIYAIKVNKSWHPSTMREV